uniref:Uncharacterized protein n=1 Tax=Caenorhabditis japonica TaxID=281687 RepID=A0A8R1EQ87_CAEJA
MEFGKRKTLSSSIGRQHPFQSSKGHKPLRQRTASCRLLVQWTDADIRMAFAQLVMEGHLLGIGPQAPNVSMFQDIWLIKDLEVALTFNDSSSRTCGVKLIVTDQGYGVNLAERTKRSTENTANKEWSVDGKVNYVKSGSGTAFGIGKGRLGFIS